VNVKYVAIILNTSIFLFQNASAQAALQAASALSGQNETQGGPNTVLRVIIEHMVYPVTLEVLCQVSGVSHVPAKWNTVFPSCWLSRFWCLSSLIKQVYHNLDIFFSIVAYCVWKITSSDNSSHVKELQH